ncbi:MAG: tetratricopeptide repeat protein [Bacteroidia bacterium]
MSFSLSAQTYIDSLETRWKNAGKEDKIIVLNDLMEELFEVNPSKALDYFEEANKQFGETAFQKTDSRLYLYKGIAHINIQQIKSASQALEVLRTPPVSAEKRMYANLLYAIKLQNEERNDSAKILFEEVFPWFDQTKDSLILAIIYRYLGSIQMETGNQNAADSILDISMRISRSIHHFGSLAKTLENTGRLNSDRGYFAEALDNYTKALQYFERVNSSVEVNFMYFYMGNIQARRGDYEEAIKSFQRALEGFEKDQNSRARGYAQGSLAGVYKEMGELSKAIQYYHESISTSEKFNDLTVAANNHINLGGIYLEEGVYEKALQHLQMSLQINKEINDPIGLTGSYHGLSEYYGSIDSLSLAIVYSDSALALAQSINYLILENTIHEVRVGLFEKQQKFDLALMAHKAFKVTHDSLFSKDRESIFLEIQEQYKTKEQKQQIELLEKEQAIQQLWVWSLIIGLILVGVIAGLAYNRYLVKNRAHNQLNTAYSQLRSTQEKLIQSEKMASLGLMTAGIAHELKNPLNFILNFSTGAKEIADEMKDLALAYKDTEDIAIFDEIMDLLNLMEASSTSVVENGRRANDIVSGMMEHTRTSHGEWNEVAINPFIQDNTSLGYHGFLARGKDLDIQIEYDLSEELTMVNIQPRELARVIINLVSNACDALQAKAEKSEKEFIPRIKIGSFVKEGRLVVSVWDNGTGIPEEIISNIYNPFFTTKQSGSGNTGLGLSISYDIIVKGHQGELQVNSQVDQFTEFLISIPVGINK